MRIDKFIWTVRLAKTRSLATKLCNQDKVTLNDDLIKAAKTVKSGDEISIKSNPIWRSYKILDLPKSRVGAKLVPDFISETTPTEMLEILENVQEVNRKNKILGVKGRPTKKDRRDMDRFKYLK